MMNTQNILKIIGVVGARPNFMKMAPLMEEMKKFPRIEPILVHTGQHYDDKMSKLFFEDLGIPKPDIELEVGSASHAVQTARVMERFETILVRERPHLVMVVGDVNSTFACALTAAKLCIPIAHIEAGLRSFDRTMPEEINRVLTDSLSMYLFTTERNARENLLREGVSEKQIYFVGNVMIDTLLKHKAKSEQSKILERFSLVNGSPPSFPRKVVPYAVLTMHRPGNVDNLDVLNDLLSALLEISRRIPVVFPCHPRTRKQVLASKFASVMNLNDPYLKLPQSPTCGLFLVEPLGYLDFLCLVSHAELVLTDSGGIQEETTVLGVPCLTLRDNTERPVTVTEGTNRVVGRSRERIIEESLKAIRSRPAKPVIPELWDGQAAARIVKILSE